MKKEGLQPEEKNVNDSLKNQIIKDYVVLDSFPSFYFH